MITDIKRVDLRALLADLPEDPKLALTKICRRVQDALEQMDRLNEEWKERGVINDRDLIEFDRFTRECIFIVGRWCERNGFPVPETEGVDAREVWRNLLDHAHGVAGTSSAEH